MSNTTQKEKMAFLRKDGIFFGEADFKPGEIHVMRGYEATFAQKNYYWDSQKKLIRFENLTEDYGYCYLKIKNYWVNAFYCPTGSMEKLLVQYENNPGALAQIEILEKAIENPDWYFTFCENAKKEKELQKQEDEKQRELRAKQREEQERIRFENEKQKYISGQEIGWFDFEQLCNENSIVIPIQTLGAARRKVTRIKSNGDYWIKRKGKITLWEHVKKLNTIFGIQK